MTLSVARELSWPQNLLGPLGRWLPHWESVGDEFAMSVCAGFQGGRGCRAGVEKMVVPVGVSHATAWTHKVATRCWTWSREALPVQWVPCLSMVCGVLEERTGRPQWLGLESRPETELRMPKQLHSREVTCWSRSHQGRAPSRTRISWLTSGQ